MGLFDLFEEIFDFVTDLFDGDTENKRKRQSSNTVSAGSSAMSASDANSTQAFWDKLAGLVSPEWIEALCRETGLSNFQVSFQVQKPYRELVQRLQSLGRPLTDADIKAGREEIRRKIIHG